MIGTRSMELKPMADGGRVLKDGAVIDEVSFREMLNA
jgi:hypothetical protein